MLIELFGISWILLNQRSGFKWMNGAYAVLVTVGIVAASTLLLTLLTPTVGQ